MLLTSNNVDKSTCWEPKVAFLITPPIMIGQLYKHAAGKKINWKLVNGPNSLPTVECQPALRGKFEFNVCACVWCAYGPHILYYSLEMIRSFTESYNH